MVGTRKNKRHTEHRKVRLKPHRHIALPEDCVRAGPMSDTHQVASDADDVRASRETLTRLGMSRLYPMIPHFLPYIQLPRSGLQPYMDQH